jgi:hypothetical protein
MGMPFALQIPEAQDLPVLRHPLSGIEKGAAPFARLPHVADFVAKVFLHP